MADDPERSLFFDFLFFEGDSLIFWSSFVVSIDCEDAKRMLLFGFLLDFEGGGGSLIF